MDNECIWELKSAISRQIGMIESNGYAYLGPVLREALFGGTDDKIDWASVKREFIKHNPESNIAFKAQR